MLCVAVALMTTACGSKKDVVRFTADLEDATITKVVYAPVSLDSPEVGGVEAAVCDGGYCIPDDGNPYFLFITVSAGDENVTRPNLLMPGERLQMKGQIFSNDKFEITGSDLYETMYREIEEVKPLTRRFSDLSLKRMAGGELTQEEVIEFDSLNKWAFGYLHERIEKYPESPVSAIYLYSCVMEPDSVYEALYGCFSDETRNGRYKALFDGATPEKVRAWKERKKAEKEE